MTINEFHLKHLTTDDLRLMKNSITQELSIRRQEESKARFTKAKSKLAAVSYDDVRSVCKEIFTFNRSKPLHVPSIYTSSPHQTKKYLSDLMNQNWVDLFDCESESGNFYVYAHIDPRQKAFVSEVCNGGNWMGQPFYIGKGSSNRAWDMKRNQGHGLMIKQIANDGYDLGSIVKIVAKGLSEKKALELESKLIYFFGLTYDKSRKFGWLLNLDVPKIPNFNGYMIRYPNLKSESMLQKAKNRLQKEVE
jgi:hypothetical protein